MRAVRTLVATLLVLLATAASASALQFVSVNRWVSFGPDYIDGYLALHPQRWRWAGHTGAYVDNETPHRCSVALNLRNKGLQPVVVSSAPEDTRGCRHRRGVYQVREWYPYGTWGDCSARIPAPSAYSTRPLHWRWNGYIVQWDFAWPGCSAPTSLQRQRLLVRAAARDPLFLWEY